MTRHIPEFLAMFDRLLATPSVSCTEPRWDEGNLGVVELLAEWTETLGFRCEIQPMPQRADKANLIAVLGEGPGGLVLSGHTDTVPYDEALWNMNPFGLTVHDERLYGLGASDMKGFFAVALEAAQAFHGRRLREPLILVATADEESSMDGANELVASGRPRARHAIVGEPTDLRPVRMHKGMMMEAVTVTGHSGHSSNPALGRNALDGMQQVMAELIAFRAELATRHHDPLFDVAVPTLNLGCIHGGDNPNRICGACELHFDLRPLPGMSLDELRATIRERLARIADATGLGIAMRSLFPGLQPFAEDAGAAIVRAAEEFTGYSAGSVAFGTESPLLQRLGMQTVVLGPGSIRQAHQPDEYMERRQVEPMVGLLQRMIERFCVDGEPA
ncbi:MAG TPA: acetylornithine deacetylase [Pseudomonadales bacterium]|nr:acetylornithine deacetylase [Pseudomonadales bacterium]